MTGDEAMNRQVSVENLCREPSAPGPQLGGRAARRNVLTGEAALKPTIGQVGHMNHPSFRIQIIGAAEATYLRARPERELETQIDRLSQTRRHRHANGRNRSPASAVRIGLCVAPVAHLVQRCASRARPRQ
jgi:hypothetical protein